MGLEPTTAWTTTRSSDFVDRVVPSGVARVGWPTATAGSASPARNWAAIGPSGADSSVASRSEAPPERTVVADRPDGELVEELPPLVLSVPGPQVLPKVTEDNGVEVEDPYLC